MGIALDFLLLYSVITPTGRGVIYISVDVGQLPFVAPQLWLSPCANRGDWLIFINAASGILILAAQRILSAFSLPGGNDFPFLFSSLNQQ